MSMNQVLKYVDIPNTIVERVHPIVTRLFMNSFECRLVINRICKLAEYYYLCVSFLLLTTQNHISINLVIPNTEWNRPVEIGSGDRTNFQIMPHCFSITSFDNTNS